MLHDIGYREACIAARERLEAIAMDNSAQPDAFRRDLVNIARTTLSSKILTQVRLQSARSHVPLTWIPSLCLVCIAGAVSACNDDCRRHIF